MKQFEYFTERKHFSFDTRFKEEFEYLNDMGSDGWQLCHKEFVQENNRYEYIFMREVHGYPVSQGSPQVTGIVSPHH